jgi:hypothetical protein
MITSILNLTRQVLPSIKPVLWFCFFVAVNYLPAQTGSVLPIVCINGVEVIHDLSFLDKLGLANVRPEREPDEAYGVDSIYYYRLDSFSLTYLIENTEPRLAGITLSCSACFSLSNGAEIRYGDRILTLIQKYPRLFATANPDLKVADALPEEVDKWPAISLKVQKPTNFVSSYNFGLVNFSLEEGRITGIDVQYYLE